MLRGGARQAVATGAKKEDDPSVATAQFLAAFHAMTQHEQVRVRVRVRVGLGLGLGLGSARDDAARAGARPVG